jgi:recombinational DNA repair protein (RecF pathway)
VLQTFQPLLLSWSGKSEVRTLTGAEWVGGMLPLGGDGLLCGFYVNELLVKFCAREDPHPPLFGHYVLTLTRLAHGEPAVQVLRSFERVLLRETGYAMALNRTVARRAVEPSAATCSIPSAACATRTTTYRRTGRSSPDRRCSTWSRTITIEPRRSRRARR